MVATVWSPKGFYQIVALPKGMKLDTDYYISHIFDPLAKWPRSQDGGSDRRLSVDADNACPHTAKKIIEFLACNGMKTAPHPPYSPDLAACEFCSSISNPGPHVNHSRSPINCCRGLTPFFGRLKKPHWNACFRSGWTYWGNVVRQLVVQEKVRKKV
jgi:hypothetical protein